MKPLFEHYRAQRPVYALDLPGFGHSDRSKRRYSPELFAGVIAEFLEQVVKVPADVAAFSLGCEFAARATLQQPTLVTSLTLLSRLVLICAAYRPARQQNGHINSSAFRSSMTVYSACSRPAPALNFSTIKHL
ncbi:alpha/beta fold hydrolase [Chromatium okenii]|uniref:AB hydrolase-1 domain-containing protein n=1 Tax=Chromatium okenii TaxID=61644 RepID=A0A2S7XVA5_9GAMM|nr:alpha/beta fold hydrolase [Chromatium okenii]PQJ97667.1 hypothetical protein CXB77_00330 [Chromatium okenii]